MDEAPLLGVLAALGIQPAQIKRNKGWIDFRCPLASQTHPKGVDRSPSAGVTISPTGRSRWHCFTCHSKGSLADLARRLEVIQAADYSTLIKQVEDGEAIAGFSMVFNPFDAPRQAAEPEPLMEEVYANIWPPAWDVPEARTYLEARGIGEAASRSLGLVYSGREHPDRVMRERILFPVRDPQGRLFGFTGRAIRPEAKPKIYNVEMPNKRALILGAHRWRPQEPVILVEGLFGYAALVERGVEALANLGAIMGSSLSAEQASILVLHGAPVYLLLDNDAAGEAGIFGHVDERGRAVGGGALDLLKDHLTVMVPNWPESKTDPDELTRDEVALMLEVTNPWGFTEIPLYKASGI